MIKLKELLTEQKIDINSIKKYIDKKIIELNIGIRKSLLNIGNSPERPAATIMSGLNVSDNAIIR